MIGRLFDRSLFQQGISLFQPQLRAQQGVPTGGIHHNLRVYLERRSFTIENMGEWVFELEYRFPTIGDLRKVAHLDEDKDSLKIAEVLLGRLTNLVGEGLGQMSQIDLQEAAELIARFSHRRPSEKPEELS